MARIRTVKPEFWSDEKVSPLDPTTRLVFIGLISMADDAGRLHDNLKIIDAFIFPNSDDTARESLANLSRIGRIARGKTKSGQSVIQIVNWKAHQKVDHPNFAACLPEIVSTPEVTTIREPVANDSRTSLETVATHTYDQRPTTNDLSCGEVSPRVGKPKPDRKPRQRNEIVDALAIVHGLNPAEITSSGGAMLGKCAAEIKEVSPSVTADEIKRRAANLAAHFPNAATTAPSLAKHWGRCAAPPGGNTPPADDAKAAAMRRSTAETAKLLGELL